MRRFLKRTPCLGRQRLEKVIARLRHRDGDYALTEARHSRLGPLGAAFVAVGGSVELLAGDVLDLTYAPDAGASPAPSGWYAIVRRQGTATPTSFSQRRLGDASLPASFALHPNEPNPAGTSTLIRFDLPAESMVRLEVFDLLGRRVATLADRSFPAGRHEAHWNLHDPGGAAARPGVYIYRLTAGEFRARRKMSIVP